MKKSIINNNKICLVCGTNQCIHKHHVFPGLANRKKSDDDGLFVYLCAHHHNASNDGVHFNKSLDKKLRQMAQRKWMEYYNKSIDDFIKRYGRNYL